jgi:hypothetical protein
LCAVPSEEQGEKLTARDWGNLNIDGRVKGKIELHKIEDLVIIPARIPEPTGIAESQIEEKVTPRQVTIQGSATRTLSGKWCSKCLLEYSNGTTRTSTTNVGISVWRSTC